MYQLQEANLNDELDKTNQYLKKQLNTKEQLTALEVKEIDLLKDRSQLPSRIKVEDMPDGIKYNKLNMESKRFQNIIKIICYIAETSCANFLAQNFKKHINEKRAMVKSIINAHADIIPDYNYNQLTVKIYSQANPRANNAIEPLINLLNETQTKYPGTNLVLNYKIAT